MKKLILLLSLIVLIAGCAKKDNQRYEEPLAPYGTFAGKFTRTHTDPTTSAKDITTANIEMATSTTGFMLISSAEDIHAKGNGDFLGTETLVEFNDFNYPITGPGTKTYLHGVYSYTFNGTDFKLTKQSGNDLYEYALVKK